MEGYFKVKISETIEEKLTGPEQERVLARWRDLQVSDLEEKYLTALLSPVGDDWDVILSYYRALLESLRGGKNGIYPLTIEELDRQDLSISLLSDDIFSQRILHSVYWWDLTKSTTMAEKMLDKFRDFTAGDFNISGLTENLNDFYAVVIILLFYSQFYALPLVYQMLFVSSPMLYSGITLGLDMEAMVATAVDERIFFGSRKELSTNLAVFIADNDFKVGFNPATKEPVAIDFWIDQFRVFSKGKFDGMSALNFFQDESVWGDNDIGDKMLIKEVLMIYGYLVSLHFVFQTKFPVENSDKVGDKDNLPEARPPRVVDIKNQIDNKFKKDERGNYADLAGVLATLTALSQQYQDPKISELYYFDEVSGKFKWQE